MESLIPYGNGLVFVSKDVSRYKGAFMYPRQRPCICDKCHSRSGRFHAHGHYKRYLNTLKDQLVVSVKIWVDRWLCLSCGRTMITPPPDCIRYVPNCTLIVLMLLASYLNAAKVH